MYGRESWRRSIPGISLPGVQLATGYGKNGFQAIIRLNGLNWRGRPKQLAGDWQ